MVKKTLAALMLGAMSLVLWPGGAQASVDRVPTLQNITCNDGTTSPTCQDCHRGCCSWHGGCR